MAAACEALNCRGSQPTPINSGAADHRNDDQNDGQQLDQKRQLRVEGRAPCQPSIVGGLSSRRQKDDTEEPRP